MGAIGVVRVQGLLGNAALAEEHDGAAERLARLLAVVLQRQLDPFAQVVHLDVDVALERVRRAVLLATAGAGPASGQCSFNWGVHL